MPLIPTLLNVELSKLMIPENPQFVGHPNSGVAEVAQNWSNAINQYASTIGPPSTTAQAAKAAMLSVLLGGEAPNSWDVIMPLAFTAYAATLGAGMAPTFSAVPPINPINLSAAWNIPKEKSFDLVRVSTLVGLIDAWFRTGQATNNSSGATVPWF